MTHVTNQVQNALRTACVSSRKNHKLWREESNSSCAQAGFTLVEIAVAVAILGLALTTLIGLHTRMLDTYYNEKNRTKSAFLAQYVMTMLEVSADPPDTGTKEDPLFSRLEEIGYLDTEEERSEIRKQFEGWTITQEVTSIDLPLIEDALRRVDVLISWGPTQDETFSLVYFIDNSQAAGAAGLGALGSGT